MITIRVILTSLLAGVCLAHADVKPASLFCDHAVLQQGRPLPVWGTAEEGEKVTVSFSGQTLSTVARDGKWSVRIPAQPAGGPHLLTIAGKNRIEITDVYIGEVWVCGGQSNMERQLGPRKWQKPIRDWEAEAAAAKFPLIRHFGVAQRLATDPQARAEGEWLVCTPETAPEFTAVGFFFARALHLARGTPIGLIHSSWGGTPAEAWTSREGLAQLPEMTLATARLDRVRRDPVAARSEFDQELTHWFLESDPGSDPKAPWNASSLDTTGWKEMKLPSFWENAGLGQFDGIVWFRREFELPADWANADLELHLGAIDDSDSTWVNGQYVGGSLVWNEPRVYRLPRGLLKPGRNVISVRVLDTGGDGGLWGSDTMRLCSNTDPTKSIPLDGTWSYRVSADGHALTPPPMDPSISSGTPTVLYNGMIAPLVPYAIRGVIWYQGEANAGQPQLYRRLFPNLVADWRRAWGQGDFPFLYVQIAPFKGMPPEIREAQRLALSAIPNSAMTVTLDVGDAADIHPADKRPVGERLALSARCLAYGEPLEYSGPLFESMEVIGERAVLSFSHLGGGLIGRGGELTGFTLAGPDKVFHPAHARIVGETIEVSAEGVKAPATVRYAWASAPEGNLYNRAGLPASPFATDSR
jgi:sialate O-acetylesterase